MPPVEDDIQEMDDLGNEVSSDQDDAAPAKAGETAARDGSSPSSDDQNTEGASTSSIVRDVVSANKEPAAASSASDEETGDVAGDQPQSEDDEGYSDVPFNKHPRFQQILRERNSLKQDATRYRNVEGFLAQNNLSGEEAFDLLEIGGLIKTDPAEAWRRMQPKVQEVLRAAGEVLPDDLRGRVEAGELNRDAALELSRLRARDKAQGVRRTFEEQQTEQRQQRETSASISTAVEGWEADRRKRDPNFEAKHPALLREIAFLHQTEGRPSTVDGVKAQLKRAYEAVNAAYRPPQPSRPQPRAVAPVGGGNTAGNARPEPRNTLDIIRARVAESQAS